MDNMKVIVCGGRDFNDAALVFKTLDRFHDERGIAELIEGGARGADSFAGEWAAMNRVKRRTVAADWEMYGRAAGPMRNESMLAMSPDAVIAFPGGRGTAHMVRIAKAAGVEVIELAEQEAQ